jgi:hypothetical protein
MTLSDDQMEIARLICELLLKNEVKARIRSIIPDPIFEPAK